MSPIATVGSYRGYLLVQTPLPWPRDIGEIPALAELSTILAASNLRLQAVLPCSVETPASERRVILYGATEGGTGFGGYRRVETRADGTLPDTVGRLIAAAQGESAEGIDVLVCTHGRRDVCCGSRGTDLALQVAAGGVPPAMRLWRTSHTGGHRFAPTFLVLPDGTGWAFADAELVHRVVERAVPFSEVAAHYRGCAGLPGPQVQVLEREVLVSEGWDLMDRPRTGALTGETTSDGGLVVGLQSGSDRWEGVVRPGRTLPVPECMKPATETKKSETEWIVSDVHQVA